MFLLRLHSILAFPDMIVDKNVRFTLCRYFRINSCLMHIFDPYITYKEKGNEAKHETESK